MRLARAALSFGLAAALCAQVWADDRLKYQKRGNRSEGIQQQLVAGFHVELLSARIDYKEPVDGLGARMFLRFYLPEDVAVYPLVRALQREDYYYRLDDVRPKVPWRKGFGNIFDWPTGDVIRHLDGLTPDALGVLVRLGGAEPSARERVAPALLYQSQAPARVEAYEFAFVLDRDAKLTAQVFKEGEAQAAYSKTIERQLGGEPLYIRWPAAQAAPGTYRLLLSGYVRSNNEKVYQEVLFHHQPVVQ